MEFLQWLESLSFSTWVRESPRLIAFPALLFVHTLGMSIVAGGSAVISMALLGFWPNVSVKPLERRVFDAKRAGQVAREDTPGQIDEAERKGVISADEARAIRAFDARVMDLTGVDDFAADDLAR